MLTLEIWNVQGRKIKSRLKITAKLCEHFGCILCILLYGVEFLNIPFFFSVCIFHLV